MVPTIGSMSPFFIVSDVARTIAFYVATLGLRPFGNGADALRKILLNEYKLPSALRPDYP